MVRTKFFQPFDLIGYRQSDDVKDYGLRLDLTTELTWYTYDWGWGFVVRILGFGIEYCNCAG